jgi:hypothetical protein
VTGSRSGTGSVTDRPSATVSLSVTAKPNVRDSATGNVTVSETVSVQTRARAGMAAAAM